MENTPLHAALAGAQDESVVRALLRAERGHAEVAEWLAARTTPHS